MKKTATSRSKALSKGATRKQVSQPPALPWRKLVSVGLGLSLMLSLGWGGYQLLGLMDRPLEQVVIKGDFQHLNLSAIEQLVQQRVDAGLLAADLDEIQQLLMEEPWIEQVAVRRKWPNLLRVDLVERVPLVRWNNNALMTAKAEIFRPKENLARYQLPRLIGDADNRMEILALYQRLQRQLQSNGLTVLALKREQRGAWQVQLSQGFRVELGSKGIDEKMQRFSGLYRHLLSDKVDWIEAVDLRYTHGAAVQWKSGFDRLEVSQRGDGSEFGKRINGSKV